MGCTASSPQPHVADGQGGDSHSWGGDPSMQGSIFEETEPEPSGPDMRPEAKFVWYWEEDAARVNDHHTWDKQGNFIAYPPKVSTYLEDRYATGGSADDLKITYKPYHAHTGFSYRVDFRRMRQINRGTGYERAIIRRENPHYVAPVVAYATVMPAAVEVTENGAAPPPADLFTAALKTIALSDFEARTAGCDINHEVKTGGTLLTWAAEVHRPDLCASVLRRGADINKPDWTSGNTPLQWAELTA